MNTINLSIGEESFTSFHHHFFVYYYTKPGLQLQTLSPAGTCFILVASLLSKDGIVLPNDDGSTHTV